MESDVEHQTNSAVSTRRCGKIAIKVLHLCLISVTVLLLVAMFFVETEQPSYVRQGYWIGSLYFVIFLCVFGCRETGHDSGLFYLARVQAGISGIFWGVFTFVLIADGKACKVDWILLVLQFFLFGHMACTYYEAKHHDFLCKRGRAAAPSDEGPVEEGPNITGRENESSTNVTHVTPPADFLFPSELPSDEGPVEEGHNNTGSETESSTNVTHVTPPADFLFPSEMPTIPDSEELEELPQNYHKLEIRICAIKH
ncbi:hypothetical protein Aperf_G00000098512 [Anoplocephala perfoliata]